MGGADESISSVAPEGVGGELADSVIAQFVEVRQLRQRGPLLHQGPAARRLANRLQDDLGGEGWEIHART